MNSFAVTFFPDYGATRKAEENLTLDALAELIRSTSAPSKDALPWLKTARFGDLPTAKNSLRWNGNVLRLTGVVADYDGEQISPADAAEKLDKAGVRGLIYTSPSHMLGHGPRWRVLCPFAREMAPDLHYRMMARLNGIFGGALAPESFVLSQSYYYGSINGNREHRTIVVDGMMTLDRCDELDQFAVGKANGDGKAHACGKPEAPIEDIRAALAVIPNPVPSWGQNADWNEWNTVGMAIWRASGGSDDGFKEFDKWSSKSSKYDGEETEFRWRHYFGSPPSSIGFGSLVHLARETSPGWQPPSRPQRACGSEIEGCAILEKGSKCMPKRVEWVWDGYLPKGKIAVLAGMKAAGKSTLSFNFGATITSGGLWPDKSQAEPGDVLIWSAEDDFDDTILPRFLTAGGNPERIYHVRGILTKGGNDQRPFDPAQDLPALLEAARQLPAVRLVIVDPVVMAIPSGNDSHKNTETRRGLQPLVDFAAALGVCVLGITHFTKSSEDRNPIDRVIGSIAFGALPRIVLGASADEDGHQRRLVRIASNIGPTGGGFEYTLFHAPVPGHDFFAQRVDWGVQLKGDPRELLNATKRSAEAAAKAFLMEFLAAGPRSQPDVKKAADAHGHSWGTIRRAKDKLGIKPIERDGHWWWQLPPDGMSTWGQN